MSVPLIEVCIPVWNESHRIRGTLDALVAQTLKDFRVRVYDNASTDNTVEICESYADQLDIEVFARTCNAGQTFNINRCFQNAQSEFVALLSGNDIPSQNYLGVLYETITRSPDVGVTYAHAVLVSTDDSIAPSQPPQWKFFSLIDDDPIERACKSILLYNQASNFFALYRRSVLDRVLPQPLCYGGDHIFAAEASLYGKVVLSEETIILRSTPPEFVEKRNAHLMKVFSMDHARGVSSRSKLSRFEDQTPAVDMFHGFINMFRLADLNDSERGRLIECGCKAVKSRYQSAIDDDVKRFAPKVEALTREFESGDPISRISLFNLLSKLDQVLLARRSAKLMELRNNLRAIYDYKPIVD